MTCPTASIPISIALAAPSIRLTLVAVGPDLVAAFYPVVAIVASHRHHYVRPDGRAGCRVTPSHREMQQAGWEYRPSGQVEYDALILLPDGTIAEAASALRGSCHALAPEEARTAPLVEKLTAQAKARAAAGGAPQ